MGLRAAEAQRRTTLASEWRRNMAVTFLKHEDESIDFVSLLKCGSIHYVSVAMPGLTFASAY